MRDTKIIRMQNFEIMANCEGIKTLYHVRSGLNDTIFMKSSVAKIMLMIFAQLRTGPNFYTAPMKGNDSMEKYNKKER